MHVYPYASWADAATNIQSAVDGCGAGGVVRIWGETFVLPEPVSITNGITVAGVSTSDTVISGADSTRCFFLAHSNAVVRGLTITDGLAGDGGGVYVDQGGSVIDCVVRDCAATNAYVEEGGAGGGGIFCFGGGLVSNCHVYANAATNEGGGVFCYLGGTTSHCIVSNNVAFDDGGGVVCRGGGVLQDSVITGNRAIDNGGGVQCRGAGAAVERCVVKNNRGQSGGGVYCRDGGRALGCLIVENKTHYSGAGIMASFDVVIESCTVANNVAEGSRGGLLTQGEVVLINCIIYHNEPSDLFPGPYLSATNLCSSVPHGFQYLAAAPSFVDRANGDYRLQYHSPCIDAGTNLSWMVGAMDLQGNPRIGHDGVDIGALEHSLPFDIYVAPGGANQEPYGSWTDAATNLAEAIAYVRTGHRVRLGPGRYPTRGPLVIDRAMTIQGAAGATQTILEPQGEFEVMRLAHPQAIVEGVGVYGGAGRTVVVEGELVACHIVSNRLDVALWAQGGEIRSCTLRGNKGVLSLLRINAFVAIRPASVSNCLIVENGTGATDAAAYAMAAAIVQNCTFAHNSGIGFYGDGAMLRNCIVAGNRGGSQTAGSFGVEYSCIAPLRPGNGNIALDPRLDHDGGLRFDSPCIDAGTATASAFDIDGEARWDDPAHSNVYSIVDMGCDEFVDGDGDQLPDAWELNGFGGTTNWDEQADADGDNLANRDEYFAGTDPERYDTDGDSASDGGEVIAGTSPRDELEYPSISAISSTGAFAHVSWSSVTGRVYSLYGADAVTQGLWHPVADATGLVGTGSELVATNALLRPRLFYRLGIRRAD